MSNVDVPFYFLTRLPVLHGGAPPATCPICGAKQVPPGSDDGIPPPEMHEYICNASYSRPEDQPEGPWEPCHRCGRVSLPAAAAWIRDFSSERCIPAATIMNDVVTMLPPYDGMGKSVLEVLFGNIDTEQPPLACPSCGASGMSDLPHFWNYACGASFGATSARPSAMGYIPMSWVGRGPCPQAPLSLLLEILRAKAKREGNERIATAAAAALRALESRV